MQTSTNTVNFVFYAENQEAASNLANSVVGGTQQGSTWVNTTENLELRGYIRWPRSTPTATPVGITDCLVVQTTLNSENLSVVRSYVDSRRGIPFKVVVSDDDMTEWATSLGMEYVATSALSTLQAKLVASAQQLDQTLRNVFNAIDTNQNGFVEKSEILSLSTQLGHQLNESEASEIASTLAGEEGNVSYAKFKNWWVTGRTNFVQFRNLVELEMKVKNYIKKGSDSINKYFNSVQNQYQTLSTGDNSSFKANFNFGPNEEFNNGVGLSVHVAVGNDYQNTVSGLPEYITQSPVCYSLELGVRDAETGAMIVNRLRDLKEMVSQFVDQLQQAESLGVAFNFRSFGTSVFIDVTLGGMLGHQVQSQMSQFSFVGQNLSGNSNLHVVSGWLPTNIVNQNLEQNIHNASHLKIEGSGEYTQIKALVSAFTNAFTANYTDYIPNRVRTIIYGLKLLTCLKGYNFQFKYGAQDLVEIMREGVNMGSSHNIPEGETGFSFASKNFEALQAQLLQFVEQGKSMVMFIGEYVDVIKSLNLDVFSINFFANTLRAYYKTSFQFPGVSSYLNETFFS